MKKKKQVFCFRRKQGLIEDPFDWNSEGNWEEQYYWGHFIAWLTRLTDSYDHNAAANNHERGFLQRCSHYRGVGGLLGAARCYGKMQTAESSWRSNGLRRRRRRLCEGGEHKHQKQWCSSYHHHGKGEWGRSAKENKGVNGER